MSFDKICIVTAIFLFSSLPYLFGGKGPQPTIFGIHPKSMHPLDILIASHFEKIKDKNFVVSLKNQACYSGSRFLIVSGICFLSPFKREKEEDVKADFIHVCKKIIETYNNIPEIRPYINRFPISIRDVSVWIKYEKSPDNYYSPPFFAIVSSVPSDGTVVFRRRHGPPEKHFSLEAKVFEKKYEEIPELQEMLNPSIPRKKEKVTPISVDKDVKKMSQGHFQKHHYPVLLQLEKKFGLHLMALRDTAIGREPYREIGSGFWVQNKNIKIDEAKKFTENFIEEYLTLLKKKKVIEKTFRKDDDIFDQIKEHLNWFCFRITFWDEYLNRVEEPYIAQIQCQDGTIHYFAADEGQRLYKVLEEPIPARFFPKGEDK